MTRRILATGLVAILVGALAGYLWWGLPAGRVNTELRDARSAANRLEEQVGELRSQLGAEQSRRATVERDLRAEKEMNSRLHLLVSEGKK